MSTRAVFALAWLSFLGIPTALFCWAFPDLQAVALGCAALIAVLSTACVPSAIAAIERRALDRRWTAIARLVADVPRAELAAELAYRDRVMTMVRDRLAPGSAVKEYPLPMKTNVDGYFEHGGYTWLVSIKVGLNSQSRKIMQGEVEDIIRYYEARGFTGTIFVLLVVALPEAPTLLESHQLEELRSYADHRVAQMITKDRLSPPYCIEVVPTSLADVVEHRTSREGLKLRTF